jgi:hypothetical protein
MQQLIKDTGWVVVVNKSRTIKDFKRTVEFAETPTKEEIKEILKTCPPCSHTPPWHVAQDRTVKFYGCYDSSD